MGGGRKGIRRRLGVWSCPRGEITSTNSRKMHANKKNPAIPSIGKGNLERKTTTKEDSVGEKICRGDLPGNRRHGGNWGRGAELI